MSFFIWSWRVYENRTFQTKELFDYCFIHYREPQPNLPRNLDRGRPWKPV